MAISDYQDFRIFNDEFYGGVNEVLEQNAGAFNEQSNGAIRLITERSLGHFQEEAFFNSLGAGLVTRRDGTTLTAATHLGLASDTWKNPKLLRKVGPVSNTLDSIKKIGISREMFSFKLGQQVAKAKTLDFLNTVLAAGVACGLKQTSGGPSGNGTVISHTSVGNTLRHAYLIEALAAMGDAANQIVAWVGRSAGFFALMGQQVDIASDRVGGATIYEGTVGTLGLPFIVTDSEDLVNVDGIAASDNSNYTLALTADALICSESEEMDMIVDIPTGNENLYVTIQGEHAYNVGVKGYSYTGAGENPTDAALATGSNWTNKMADQKSTGVIVIEHDE